MDERPGLRVVGEQSAPSITQIILRSSLHKVRERNEPAARHDFAQFAVTLEVAPRHEGRRTPINPRAHALHIASDALFEPHRQRVTKHALRISVPTLVRGDGESVPAADVVENGVALDRVATAADVLVHRGLVGQALAGVRHPFAAAAEQEHIDRAIGLGQRQDRAAVVVERRGQEDLHALADDRIAQSGVDAMSAGIDALARNGGEGPRLAHRLNAAIDRLDRCRRGLRLRGRTASNKGRHCGESESDDDRAGGQGSPAVYATSVELRAKLGVFAIAGFNRRRPNQREKRRRPARSWRV